MTTCSVTAEQVVWFSGFNGGPCSVPSQPRFERPLGEANESTTEAQVRNSVLCDEGVERADFQVQKLCCLVVREHIIHGCLPALLRALFPRSPRRQRGRLLQRSCASLQESDFVGILGCMAHTVTLEFGD